MAVAGDSLETVLVIAAGVGSEMDTIESTIVGMFKWEGVGTGTGEPCPAFKVELAGSSLVSGGDLILGSELHDDAVDNSRTSEAGEGNGRGLSDVVFISTESPVAAFVLAVYVNEDAIFELLDSIRDNEKDAGLSGEGLTFELLVVDTSVSSPAIGGYSSTGVIFVGSVLEHSAVMQAAEVDLIIERTSSSPRIDTVIGDDGVL
jgi:hypothetical protein